MKTVTLEETKELFEKFKKDHLKLERAFHNAVKDFFSVKAMPAPVAMSLLMTAYTELYVKIKKIALLNGMSSKDHDEMFLRNVRQFEEFENK